MRRWPMMSAVLCLVLCAGVAGCSKDAETRRQEYLASGDRYMARQEYKKAVIEYGNAVQHDPKSGEAYLKLAEANTRAGDSAAAARAYVKAAELLPNDARVQILVGQLELLAGEFEAARTRADRVLANYRRHVDAQVLRANALAGLKDLNAAVGQIQEAIFSDPNRSDAYSNLGSLQLAQGNRDEAEKAFVQAVRIAPHSVPARLALANFYWSSGRPEEAERVLRDAVKATGADPLIDRAIALLYLTTNRAKDAEAFLVRAAKTAGDQDTKIALAEYYMIVGRQNDALRLLEPIAAADSPEAGVAVAHIAEIHARDGREDDASRRLEEFLQAHPQNTTALVAQARLLLMQLKAEEALEPARRAVRAQPDLLPAWLTLARVHVARGAPEDAEEALDQALAVNDTFVPALLELAYVRLSAGRTEQALEAANRALELQPHHVDAQFVQSQAVFGLGRRDEAMTVLHDVAARHGAAAPVQARLASVYASWGEWGFARAAYARALRIDPLNVDAHAGLAALDFAEGEGRRARTRLEEALVRKPGDLGLLLLGARAAFEMRDFDTAERRLRRVIELDASSLPAYTLLGQVFAARGRLAEATKQFEHVARQRPRSVPVNTALGMLLETQGNEDAARQRYEAVLQIDARAPVAANNLAWLLVKHGQDLDRALHLARTAHAGLKDRPEVNHTLGWVHYRRGSAGEAVPLLRAAVDRQPTKVLYRAHLGLASAAAGDERGACEAFRSVVRMEPGGEVAAEARQAAARLKDCQLTHASGPSPAAARTARAARVNR